MGLLEVIKGDALEPQSITPDKARGGDGGSWLERLCGGPLPRHRFKPHPLIPRDRFKPRLRAVLSSRDRHWGMTCRWGHRSGRDDGGLVTFGVLGWNRGSWAVVGARPNCWSLLTGKSTRMEMSTPLLACCETQGKGGHTLTSDCSSPPENMLENWATRNPLIILR